MKYICVQPRLSYYAWQIEVMLTNFIKNEISPLDIQILIAYSPDQSDKTNHSGVVDLYSRLMRRFPKVSFFYYKDTRITPSYISSIRPNILKQHFSNFPELETTPIFYHDCDMIFTKTPNFESLLSDKVWYMSDTQSYIGYDYIISKGEDVYSKMCEIVGIDSKIPKIMQSNSGGAQYIIKGANSTFWEKVESDSESLYRFFSIYESQVNDVNYHPIQKWTSDMWALLWNAWYFGFETKIDKYLDFTWATDVIDKWSTNLIYHNAGVISGGDLFYKGDFINKLPYHIDNTFNPVFSSYNYFQEIFNLKNKSCLLN
jgi:hypothetical protein